MIKNGTGVEITYEVGKADDGILELIKIVHAHPEINWAKAHVKQFVYGFTGGIIVFVEAEQDNTIDERRKVRGVSSVVPVTDEEAERIFREIADQEEERAED